MTRNNCRIKANPAQSMRVLSSHELAVSLHNKALFMENVDADDRAFLKAQAELDLLAYRPLEDIDRLLQIQESLGNPIPDQCRHG